jgi:hypothetical protein
VAKRNGCDLRVGERARPTDAVGSTISSPQITAAG